MKACVFVLGAILLAGVSAQNPAAKSIVPQTQQEHYLAKANVGNFACRVQSVAVSTVNPGINPSHAEKTLKDLLQKFAYVATLEWAHIAQTSFSSSDGRNDEKVLATPGGDMGEFIQVLNAYTKVSNKVLTAEEVSALFEKYIKIMTRDKFFYETDERAYLSIAIATGCRNLRVAEMGGLRHKRDAYLSVIATPEYIGDAFIRFMATNATDLGLVPDYIHHALAAYHKVLWTNPSEKAKKLCYLEMKGKHEHVALVNILTPTFCVDQGLAPMASQQLSSRGPVLLNHPEAVKIFRRELVSIFDYSGDAKVDPRDVLAAFNELAQNNLEKYWYQVGGDLPIYNVEFSNNTPLLSQDISFVDPQ